MKHWEKQVESRLSLWEVDLLDGMEVSLRNQCSVSSTEATDDVTVQIGHDGCSRPSAE
jgi:hypothetical protein